MNSYYDYLYYYQNALQTPSQIIGFTRRLYSVHTGRLPRAHGTLEDLIVLPQRSHGALTNTLCKRQAASFVLSMFKLNAADCTASSQRSHSVACDCTASTSAICNLFERCGNAVSTCTPLWCDRGLSFIRICALTQCNSLLLK